MLLGLLGVPLLGACRPPPEAIRRETTLTHPLSAPRPGMAMGIFGDLVGPDSSDRRAEEQGPRSAPGTGRTRRDGSVPLSATASLGGESPLRSSAMRLLGIRGSFDRRSFLGHLLRINDLLPPRASSQDWKAGESLRRARQAGTLRPVDRAMPGDLLFFPCEGRCGPMEDDGVAVCVVIEVGSQGGRCIGYLLGEVRWLRFGGWDSSDPAVGRVEGVSPPMEP